MRSAFEFYSWSLVSLFFSLLVVRFIFFEFYFFFFWSCYFILGLLLRARGGESQEWLELWILVFDIAWLIAFGILVGDCVRRRCRRVTVNADDDDDNTDDDSGVCKRARWWQLSLYQMNKRNAILLVFVALYAYAYIHVFSSIGRVVCVYCFLPSAIKFKSQ